MEILYNLRTRRRTKNLSRQYFYQDQETDQKFITSIFSQNRTYTNYIGEILDGKYYRELTKQFPSVKVLDNVDLEINRSVFILIKKVDIKENEIDR